MFRSANLKYIGNLHHTVAAYLLLALLFTSRLDLRSQGIKELGVFSEIALHDLVIFSGKGHMNKRPVHVYCQRGIRIYKIYHPLHSVIPQNTYVT